MYEFLKRFRGVKRVDNYIKAYKLYLERLNYPGLSREDKESILLDKEREKEEKKAAKASSQPAPAAKKQDAAAAEEKEEEGRRRKY